MTVCLRCGSLRTRVIGGGLVERLLALVLRQQVIVCARCGFRGRQRKPAGQPSRRAEGRSAAPSQPAIDLERLDRALERGPRGTSPAARD